MSVLTQANHEWSNRPADERFPSLEKMHAAAVAYRDNAAQSTLALGKLRAEADGGEVVVTGTSGLPASLTHFAFSQLANKVGAPADYLRRLPAPIAALNLNYGLSTDFGEEQASTLLFDRRNGGTKLRAVTSDKYSRIWNADVIERLLALEASGPWQPAPAAFDGSRGLYLGDRDMFAFMVDNNRRIFETGPGGGLSRGFFAWNSEVGSRSIGCATFLYEYVCGNHRVWGVEDVKELRIAHIYTDLARSFSKISVELRRYAEASAADDEAKVEAARKYEIGATKEDVLDAVFKLHIGGLTRTRIGDAYDAAEKHVDWYGSPRTAWGLAGGLTEISRDLGNADDRSAVDRAAAKVMEIAF